MDPNFKKILKVLQYFFTSIGVLSFMMAALFIFLIFLLISAIPDKPSPPPIQEPVELYPLQ